MSLLDMMAMMGGQPAATQTMGGVNSGLMQQMRALRYLRASTGGRMRSPGQQQNPMGQGMGEPDYSQFTFDPEARAAANQQLGQYGLHTLAPEDVNPNALLPNSGFFGRHPGIARGIEGGIFGAAATRGSDTWGEGISNVMQGLIGGRQMRQSMINRQFAAPFEQAHMLEGLEDMSQKRDLNSAMIDWHQAQARNADAQTANAGRKLDEHITPLGREVPGFLNSEGKYTENPGYDPKEARRAGQTENERIWEGMKGEPPTGPKARQKYYQDMDSWMQGKAVQRAGATTHARNQANLDDDVAETKTDKNARAAGSKRDQFILKAKPSFWYQKKIDPSDEGAKKSWYDKNYPTNQEYDYVPGQGLNSH